MVATRMRAGSVLLALMSLLLVTLDLRPAYACSCAGGGSTEEEFRQATAVFSGEVVEVRELPAEQWKPTDPGMMPLLAPVTFDVDAAWKGVTGDSVVVHGQGPGPSCGLNFERGETYLVFAGGMGRGGDGPLETGLCSATRQASEETARNMFGPPTGTLPETGGVLPADPERNVGPALVAAAAILASLVVGVAFVGRAVRGLGR